MPDSPSEEGGDAMPVASVPSDAVPAPGGPPGGARPDLEGLLRMAVAHGVSDIHLKPGRPLVFRRGNSTDLTEGRVREPLDSERIRSLVAPIVGEHHWALLESRGGVDLAWGIEGVGRLRLNVFRSRVGLQAVIRVIPAHVPSLADLSLPRVLGSLASERRGLILVTGAAGQGKTTTLAAVADHIARNRACHIVTIEDPIEFVLDDHRAVVTQREVLTDCSSFDQGLRAALRQDPDVIVVGEIRDRETTETALQAAETGHLVLSTMHTVNVTETVNRILSFFTEREQVHARAMVAGVLKAVCSMRLVARKDGRGRVPAVEVMRTTARIRDLLKTEEGVDVILDAVAQGHAQYGMQTFDQALAGLLKEGRITLEEALAQCSNPADFQLRARGIGSGTEVDPYKPADQALKF
jgi:twitching motility protein PilT